MLDALAETVAAGNLPADGVGSALARLGAWLFAALSALAFGRVRPA
ncbi:hypothetical protein MKK63_17210 [Methylobacterium sp. J-088]|nr:hypothetical protein [Methylobacterium sp. J-088]MCJ2064441.1 hypothetical protein [Methylobacterium sp. J-088]